MTSTRREPKRSSADSIRAARSRAVRPAARSDSAVTRRLPFSPTSPTSLMDVPGVRAAILLTQPTGPDQRRRKVFKLARTLKGIFGKRDPIELLSLVEIWHRQAEPKINHKDLEITVADFCDGWNRVRYPGNTGPLADLLERALSKPLPCVAMEYPTDCPRKLIALCRELQIEAGDQAFWIDERTAAQLLDVHQTTINFWFRMICDRGIVLRLEKGRPGRASRYRYRGELREGSV